MRRLAQRCGDGAPIELRSSGSVLGSWLLLRQRAHYVSYSGYCSDSDGTILRRSVLHGHEHAFL